MYGPYVSKKLACVFSESIHGCGYSLENCSVCADLMETGKDLCGTKALRRK